MSFKIRTDASGNGQFTIDSTDVLSINTNTTVSLPTGTANGVAYLNGSKVLTSGSALTFDGTNLRTGGITFADTSTQSTGGYTGFRNRIINGDFRVSQRGNYTTATSISGGYCVDRWYSNIGGGVTLTHKLNQTLPSGDVTNSVLITQTSTGYASLGQYIEEVATLRGKNITISFWAKTNFNPSLSVYDGASQPNSTITFNSDGNWHKYTWTLAFSSSAIICRPEIWSGTASAPSGYYFEIAQFQLEIGSVPTPFEYRPYGTELALCQRYYQTGFAINLLATPEGANANTRSFFVPMRVTPTVTTTTIPAGSGATIAAPNNTTFNQSGVHSTITGPLTVSAAAEL